MTNQQALGWAALAAGVLWLTQRREEDDVADFKLSEHFTFNELTKTTHTDLLSRNRLEAVAYQTQLRELAFKVLEPIRAHFAAPVVIHSAFRGPELNARIGGASTSQHMSGEAADITVVGVTDQAVFDWVRRQTTVPFGQVILEYSGGARWVHVSSGDRRQALVYNDGKYTIPVA